MIIIKLKVSRNLTTDHWKQMAIGTIDEYGNPFRLIKLRWNKNPLHKNTEYAKTRGFEDTELSKDPRTGDIAVTYRNPGSVMWQRPAGGVGPFIGELAQTPKNLQRLAAMYGDRLWTIMDADVDKIVAKMYQERQTRMDDATKVADSKRIADMHTNELERSDKAGKGVIQIPEAIDKLSVTEQNRINMIQAQDNEKRAAALEIKESQLNERVVDMVGSGAAAVMYQKEALEKEKIHKVRGICREIGIKWENTETKDVLVGKILLKQAGNIEKIKEQMAGVIGGGLDS